ncbi:Ldh family oxidoreductase, partial [Pseudomonas ogarae]
SVSLDALTQLLETIFLRHGTSDEVARVLAANCASAERDGAHSHGVFRIPGYVSTLKSGWVNGHAVPQVEDVASGFVRVDAGN